MSLRADIGRLIERALHPLRLRVDGLVSRAIVTAVDAASDRQLLQFSAREGDADDAVEHVEPYGLTANPPPGADAVVLSVGGRRAHSVVIVAGDRRYRLTGLAEGEVALHDDAGQAVVIRNAYVEVLSNDVRIGNGAALAAARNTDPVAVTIPAGAVCVGVLPGPPAAAIMNPAPISCTGTITAGSAKVKEA